jgi:hypothetical protein
METNPKYAFEVNDFCPKLLGRLTVAVRRSVSETLLLMERYSSSPDINQPAPKF